MSARDLIDSFTAFVTQHDLLRSDDHLLVAISGGKDSTVLTHVLLELGYRIALVHCNFQLRGTDSTEDEAFVRGLAERFSLDVHVKRVDTGKLAEGTGDSTQMVARQVRYNYFQKILDEYKYDRLLTAHQLEDSFETSLINFIRGTGLAGLRGIRPAHGRIVRPLLGSSRAEIDAYARERGITHREDRTNATDKYLRNRIRHHLLPVFADLGLTPTTLARNFQTLRGEEQLMAYGYSCWEDKVVTRQGATILVDRTLGSLDPNTIGPLLLKKCTPNAGFTSEQYRQMLAVAGSRTIIGKHMIAFISPTTIRFSPIGSPATVETATYPSLPFVHHTAGGHYVFEEVDRPDSLDTASCQYLRIPDFPLHLRPRQTGDRFAPIGMEGKRKKLKKVYQDLQLTGPERAAQSLLTGPDGTILAILGRAVSYHGAVGPGDERVLRISYIQKSTEER
ncbi:tRNA(Ile)-lysidine synthase [Neolewinella maritima]|uniref:tRNA(Ile)-lysidine synthase n=1 Tax=Neolewinella maritima TaxID=1383882 RepID=A0ABN8F7A1_9BACT|nr:tRNA lysidine(34) synthetase TilS [Neolewinella maritima]CAH1000319.1 tRNA(Ile)-lysidine synthase [Neolewinella maritima]